MAGYYSDYDPGKPLVPHQWFTEKKKPWPTLTGRQQFYIDHPWFLECGEALPTYKEPPQAGGNYPLVLGGGHTRWSIHSQWRDQLPMLRLQRGEPVVYIGTKDAAERNIKDHDVVRVRNDLGSFVLRAKVASSVPPGQILVYHAWEPYQFRSGVSDHVLIPSPFKATSLAGGYGHIRWSLRTGAEIPAHLHEHGRAVVSGFGRNQCQDMEDFFAPLGLMATERLERDAWSSLVLRPLIDISRKEPL